MPISHIRDVFNLWRYSADGERLSPKKLDPRGPDQLWSPEVKQVIIDGLVKRIGIA
jgi:hypothetical protein